MFALIARLISFLIVISLIRSAIRFVQRLWLGLTQPPPTPTAPNRAAGSTTVLQQDPVCGTYVAIDTSLKKIVAGRVVHFCSPECRDRYKS